MIIKDKIRPVSKVSASLGHTGRDLPNVGESNFTCTLSRTASELGSVDTDQAAAIMRVHPMTLQRYARQGIVRGLQLGTMWRFRASDIHKNVGWHTFRHSFGTLLKVNGEDVKTAQELLRHANSKITLDVYTQAVNSHKGGRTE